MESFRYEQDLNMPISALRVSVGKVDSETYFLLHKF